MTTVSEFTDIPAEMDVILAGGKYDEKHNDTEKQVASDNEKSTPEASVIEEHGT